MTETSTNEQLNIPVYSDKQRARFSSLCEQVRAGKISANQSYRYAQMDGEDEEDKGFKGSLKEWIETAKANQWLDELNNRISSNQTVAPIIENKPEEKSMVMPILIGVGIAVVLVYAIKKFSKKD